MKKRRYVDWSILLLCIIGFMIEFLSTSIVADITVYVLGCFGILYCLCCIVVFCYPIRRDWILAKGNFLIKVLNFVLLIPFVLASVFNWIDKRESDPRNLLFDENLYTYSKASVDTLGVSRMSIFKDPLFLDIHDLEIINDSVVIRRSKLPKYGVAEQRDPSLFWTVYCHFMDSGNQHMAASETGRKRAALIAILGFLLMNGLLISTLIDWFDRRRDLWIRGEISYRFFKRRFRLSKHYVVIGGGDVVVGIVEQLLCRRNKRGLPYIVVQTSGDVDALRRRLFSTLTEPQQRHIVLYYGSSTSEEDLWRLGLNNAEEVYILGEDAGSDDVDSYHDTLNMECLKLLQKLYMQTSNGERITAKLGEVNELKAKFRMARASAQSKAEASAQSKAEAKAAAKAAVKALREVADNAELDRWWGERPRLKCRVMFEYQTTFSVFQFFDMDEQIGTYIDFKPFNYYEMWAQKVLINREVEQSVIENRFKQMRGYLPLEGSEGIAQDSDDYVHLFIVGMSRMGVAMGIEAAHLAHYPNYTEQRPIRTKITFIDANADSEKDFFIGRFKDLFNLSHWRYGAAKEGTLVWEKVNAPQYDMCNHIGGDFLDIEWEFVGGGVEQSAIQDYILSSADTNAKVTIAICLPESNRAHAAALYLNRKIYESDRILQVLVYNRNGSAIINAIGANNLHHPYLGKLRSFGCATECMVINHVDISEYIGNQIDRAYNGGKEEYAIEEEKEYGGKSKEAMRWSSIYNGNTIWTKLRSIGFNPDTTTIDEGAIQILADVEHNRWNVEELLMNFRPLTATEQADVVAGKVTKDQKKSEMAHLNICSNRVLLEIDAASQENDKTLTSVLGDIYHKVKMMDETTARD